MRMVKGWTLGLSTLLLGLSTVAWADAPTVVEDPQGTYGHLQGLVERLQPSSEAVWNWENDTWHAGFSAALVNLDLPNVPIKGLRLGYAIDKSGYGVLNLDPLKAVALLGPSWSVPEVVQTVVSQATCGPMVGYSYDTHDPLYGWVFGAQLSW